MSANVKVPEIPEPERRGLVASQPNVQAAIVITSDFPVITANVDVKGPAHFVAEIIEAAGAALVSEAER